MSILDILKKSTPTISSETITISLIIVFVAFGSFGLGRLSRIEESKTPLRIKEAGTGEVQTGSVVSSSHINIGTNTRNAPQKTSEMPKGVAPNYGFIVGSKTGKKYHFPWCVGAQQIKEENKVWFVNETEAKTAGYTPAANCKGLE